MVAVEVLQNVVQGNAQTCGGCSQTRKEAARSLGTSNLQILHCRQVGSIKRLYAIKLKK